MYVFLCDFQMLAAHDNEVELSSWAFINFFPILARSAKIRTHFNTAKNGGSLWDLQSQIAASGKFGVYLSSS